LIFVSLFDGDGKELRLITYKFEERLGNNLSFVTGHGLGPMDIGRGRP